MKNKNLYTLTFTGDKDAVYKALSLLHQNKFYGASVHTPQDKPLPRLRKFFKLLEKEGKLKLNYPDGDEVVGVWNASEWKLVIYHSQEGKFELWKVANSSQLPSQIFYHSHIEVRALSRWKNQYRSSLEGTEGILDISETRDYVKTCQFLTWNWRTDE